MTNTDQKETTPKNTANWQPKSQEDEKPNKSSRKKVFRLIGLGFLVVLLIAGFFYYRYFESYESTDDAFIDGHFSMISPRVPGYVVKILVKDNQWVSAGDLLVELDPSDYKARLDAALAALQAARASDRARNLDVKVTTIESEAGLNEAKANLDSANAAVESAKAQLRLAQDALDQAMAEAHSAEAKHDRDAMDLKRYQQMAGTQVVTQQALEHMLAAEKISAADLTAVRKNIDTRKSMILQAEAALKQAESNQRQSKARLASAESAPDKVAQSQSHAQVSAADIQKAEAQVEQARLNLSYTKIYAPIDGYITSKKVQLGVLVQAGQSILSIVPKAVWVTANFKETQIAGIRPGQPVDIKVDSYPDITLTGYVDSLQRGTGSLFSLLPPENATGNFVKVVQRIPVKIILDPGQAHADVVLTPGMSVVAEVNIKAQARQIVPEKVAKADELSKKNGSAKP